jgi:hypothetical protein
MARFRRIVMAVSCLLVMSASFVSQARARADSAGFESTIVLAGTVTTSPLPMPYVGESRDFGFSSSACSDVSGTPLDMNTTGAGTCTAAASGTLNNIVCGIFSSGTGNAQFYRATQVGANDQFPIAATFSLTVASGAAVMTGTATTSQGLTLPLTGAAQFTPIPLASTSDCASSFLMTADIVIGPAVPAECQPTIVVAACESALTGGMICVEATSDASCGNVAVSGTGQASTSCQANQPTVAVSGTGDATTCSDPLVAGLGLDTAVSGSGMATGSNSVDQGLGVDLEGLASVGNTGVSVLPYTAPFDPLSQPDPVSYANKLAQEPLVAVGVASNLEQFATGSSVGPSVSPCPQITGIDIGARCSPPVHRETSQPLTPQERYYWCGPASTSLVLSELGVGVSQTSLAGEEGTNSRYGTGIYSVSAALNRHQRGNPFGVQQPSDPATLMSWVTEDVWSYNSSLVANVNTGGLPNWGGHSYMHYDVIYGYDHSGGGYVTLAEEYDPHYLGYNTKWDPFGYWTIRLAQMYQAIHASPTHAVVW